MSKQILECPRYKVNVHERAPGILTFKFVPQVFREQIGADGAAEPLPHYVVEVREEAGQATFDWHGRPPNAAGTTQREFEEEAQARLAERKEWIGHVAGLVAQVEQWAGDLGWSTRRIEKRLDDSRIGKHNIPALVMQHDLARTILEPISRSGPGGQGFAELSLMPSYADIASLYLRENGWYVHYTFPRTRTFAAVDEPEARQLSAGVLGLVLDGMKNHAG